MAPKRIARFIGIVCGFIAAVAVAVIILHFFPIDYLLERASGASTESAQAAPSADRLVIDAYYEPLTFIDRGEEVTYSYRIPKIDLSGGPASAINNAIDDDLKHHLMDAESLSESVDTQETGLPACTSIAYEWTLTDGRVLSLLTRRTMRTQYGKTDFFRTYNMDIGIGDRMDLTALLSYRDMEEEKYEDLARKALMSAYLDDYGQNLDKGTLTRDNAVSALARTVCRENLEQVQPYIRDDGALCIAGTVYLASRPSGIQHQICLEDFTLSGRYDGLIGDVTKAAAVLDKEYAERIMTEEEKRAAEEEAERLAREEEKKKAEEEKKKKEEEEARKKAEEEKKKKEEEEAARAAAEKEAAEKEEAEKKAAEEQKKKEEEAAKKKAEEEARKKKEEEQKKKEEEKKKKEEEQRKKEEAGEWAVGTIDALVLAEKAWGHYPGESVPGKSSAYTYDCYVWIYPTVDEPYYTCVLCISDHKKDTTTAAQAIVNARTGEVKVK